MSDRRKGGTPREVTLDVRVAYPDGRTETETATGISRRHAVWTVRDKYRGKARVDPADGGPPVH